MTTIAITNPSDQSAEAGIVHSSDEAYDPARILEEFGSKLEDGALVAMISEGKVWLYVATREPSRGKSIALRNNNALAADAGKGGDEFINYISGRSNAWRGIIGTGYHELGANEPLETYTVFGENDDSERFVAVVTARSAREAYKAGIAAGVVEDGYEFDVRIDVILKGDHSDLETVDLSEAAA